MTTKAVSILLVEDNDLDAEKLLRILDRLRDNRPITRARDGIEALEILRDRAQRPRPPFVIILDLNMPRMNGQEFLAELRADPDLKGLPVVVLTTSDRRADIEQAYANQVSGYLTKPLDLEDTAAILQSICDFWGRCEFPHAGAL